jgi:hypothetical protein
MIADTVRPRQPQSPGTSRLCGSAGQHRWQSSGARQSHLRPRAEMDVLISGPHTGPMNEPPQPAQWPTWWSWPWNMISALTNPPVSPSPPVSLAPQTLSQAILPGWLFANTVNVTEENSSSPETERQIVAAHSYGQQLGRILDAVNELIAERPVGAPDVQSIRDFENLWHDIEKIKLQPAIRRIEKAITDLAEVKQQDSGEYQRLAADLQSILEDQSGADSGESSQPTVRSGTKES